MEKARILKKHYQETTRFKKQKWLILIYNKA